MGRLSATFVKADKAPGRYADGDGLYLVVAPGGSKSWVCRVQKEGKRRDIGLGSVKKVSLAQARDRSGKVRTQVEAGLDPILERKKEAGIPTFREAAALVFAENRAAWKNKKHAGQWLSTLTTYAFPHIGNISVSVIDGQHVRDALMPIWLTKQETARRVRQRIAMVVDWAVAEGYRATPLAMAALNKSLPKAKRKVEHQAAMPYADVPTFVARLKERSVKELSHAVVIVDEASTLSSRQAADLMRVAHAAGIAKLALVGDVRQYGAVEAGKPFADLQKDGIATAELTKNVRAQSDIMRSLAPALDAGDHKQAFRILEPVTHQVPRGDATAYAVAMWAQRPREEREQTLILTSGRALRTEANREAQSVLKAIGEIGQDSHRITVLDRIAMSREEARTLAPYREGRIVEIRADMPTQGLKRGMTGTIVGGHHGRVEIRAGDRTLTLRPERLARNLKDDAIAIYAPLALDLHQNDKIRFTANNHTHGVLNAQTATVEKISDASVTLKLAGDRRLELGIDDPALKRIDLGYAINTYAAQGVTTRHGIVIMDSREQMLTSSRTLGVALTRIADQPTLVVDSKPRVERAVERNSGEKTSALDVLKDQLGGPRKPGKDHDIDGIQRFGHNENQTFEKKDFEKERDYQKELEQLLGKQKSFELGIKNFDLGM